MLMKGRRFESIDSTKENLLVDLSNILNEAFQNCFKGWKKHWDLFIQSGGDYIEGDKAE
jgi:uncharacterized protein (DUF927 family)